MNSLCEKVYTSAINMYTLFYIFVCMAKEHDKPYPLRLKDIKAPLQMQAMEQDRSLHYWIITILKNHLKNCGIEERSHNGMVKTRN